MIARTLERATHPAWYRVIVPTFARMPCFVIYASSLRPNTQLSVYDPDGRLPQEPHEYP